MRESVRLCACVAVAFLVALAPATSVAQRAPAPATAEIAVTQLPKEARETLALIKKGGPYPYAKDGVAFGNREARLPKQKRGYYREYTVKTPGERTRGARRIVAGQGGDYWYTDDHYATFRRIRE
jgi:ribonuclease T1